ncbi:sulfurtransferase [Glaciihabitans sp. dw_435]|uniref:sulfurtransferase n=1 Tax=Glaciihabitans sp. dw_435 TaxID=2720081 RepID=UPI001BD57BB3|nr:rhodanese-like domain-containing protein [Glaciihabitans sp. dw_435]
MTALELPGALVTAEWLQGHLDEVIVLDATIVRTPNDAGKTQFADGSGEFAEEHIAGALFADVFDAFSDASAPFLFTRPSAEHLQATMRALGVDTTSTVVVYDRLSTAWAARIWWVLRSFGFTRVAVLDGGLRSWKDAGGPTESGPGRTPETPGTFEAFELDGFFVDIERMKLIATGVDTTPTLAGVRHAEFTGEGGGDRPGHIPNTRSLPFPDLLDDDGLISVAKTRLALDAHDLGAEPETILYCGGAINASGLALALTVAGQTGLTIYDGSLNEWKADPALPLVTGDDERAAAE